MEIWYNQVMKKYVALLRGVNVGGNNMIKMQELKESFESLGFAHVRTYINSGNIIFDTSIANEEEIISKIESVIKNDFNLEIPVIIREYQNIREICEAVPEVWRNDKDQKTDVMFLWPKYAHKNILKELSVVSDIDTVKYVGKACVWHIEKENYAKSGINKLIGTSLYKAMTVRNINTVRKIKTLMEMV